MRGTTQKAFAQHYECVKVCNGIGRKMMKLRTKVIQKTADERMRGQRKTSLDVSEEEDPFSFAWLRLDLPLRQPPRLLSYHPMFDELKHILLPDG